MVERFGHGRARDPLGLPGAKGAARRGENEPRELGRPATRDTLKDGAVLGVHGDDFATALARRLSDQLAGHHQRLFVCQRDAFAGTQRRQRCLESCRADDSINHDRYVRMSRCLNETRGALPYPVSRFPFPAIHQARERRPPLRDLFREQIGVGMGRECDNTESVSLAREHLQRRSADRPGGSEHCDADTHITPNMRYKPAAVGITKYKESSRSSTPPWPGMSVEESLRPASRLNSDSATSPICPTMETARPNSNSWPGLKLQP